MRAWDRISAPEPECARPGWTSDYKPHGEHNLRFHMTRISSRLHSAARPKALVSVHREIDVSNLKFVALVIISVRFSPDGPWEP